MKSVNSKNRPALAKRASLRRRRLVAPLLLVALACGLLAGNLARTRAAAQDAGQKKGGASAAADGKGAGRTRATRPDAAKPAGVKRPGGAVPLDALGCTKPEGTITIGGTSNGFLGDSNDCRLQVDDTFYDAYTFQGTAGQFVTITMNAPSGGIDPFLYLLVPGETTLSDRTILNDDLDPDNPNQPNDTVNINSQLMGVLPATGTYTIIANLFPPTPSNPGRPTTGSYTLTVAGGCPATPNITNGTQNGSLGGSDCRLPNNTSVVNANALVDIYSFTVPAGQQVSVAMSSTVLDSYLYLLSTDGFTPLAVNDDGLTGGGPNNSDRGARIPAPDQGAGSGLATLPGAGTYYILASAFAPEQSGAYQLTLTLGSTCPEQPIGVGQSANGSLATSDCRLAFDGSFLDVYTFQGTAGQQINITMTSTQFDTFLLLFDPAGFSVYEDNNGGGGTNARIPDAAEGQFLTLQFTGTYRIFANAAAPGATGAYTLSVGGSNVNCTVTLAQTSRQNVPAAGGQFTDNFTVPADCAVPSVAW